MPDLDLPAWINVLLVAGAIAGSLAAMAAFMLKTGRGIKWVSDAVRDGVAQVAREQADEVAEADRLVAAQLREQVEADTAHLAGLIGAVRAEVQPNGGTSLRDVIDRVETKLDAHIRHSAADRRDLWASHADLRRWLETLDPGRHTDRHVADQDDGEAGAT